MVAPPTGHTHYGVASVSSKAVLPRAATILEEYTQKERIAFKRWLATSTTTDQMHVVWSAIKNNENYPSEVHKIKKLNIEVKITIYHEGPNYIISIINRLTLNGYFVLKKILKETNTCKERRIYKMTEKGFDLLRLIETLNAL